MIVTVDVNLDMSVDLAEDVSAEDRAQIALDLSGGVTSAIAEMVEETGMTEVPANLLGMTTSYTISSQD